MGLLADIQAMPSVGGQSLRMDRLLEELSESDAEAAAELREALAERKYTAGQITRALGKRGIICSDSSVRKWRQVNGI